MPGEMTDETWWERQVTRNRFTLWAGSWLAVVWYRKIARLYDELMLRCWPYDRWPREWKDLFFRRKK